MISGRRLARASRKVPTVAVTNEERRERSEEIAQYPALAVFRRRRNCAAKFGKQISLPTSVASSFVWFPGEDEPTSRDIRTVADRRRRHLRSSEADAALWSRR